MEKYWFNNFIGSFDVFQAELTSFLGLNVYCTLVLNSFSFTVFVLFFVGSILERVLSLIFFLLSFSPHRSLSIHSNVFHFCFSFRFINFDFIPTAFFVFAVLKTNFHCLPCQHCEHQIQQNTGGNRDAGLGEVKEKDVCDCSQISELNMLERCCEQWNLNNTDYSLSNYTADRGGLAKNVFICQTDVDMTEIHNNTLSSGKNHSKPFKHW